MRLSMCILFILGVALSLGSLVATDERAEKLLERAGNIVMLMAIFLGVAS